MAETSPPHNGDWEAEFRSKEPLYRELASEAEFALSRALERAKVRVHLVHPRAKTLSSLREKAVRKGYYDPLRQAEDLAGVRVVVLFRSDLHRVREVIDDLYDIVSEEDTIDGGEASNFGYMSVHYIVQLKSHHAGPRYDELKGLKLEIQVRTIVTDAWNTLSRYLDYKGESSIPRRLRRDFYALSGLFYVADQHFELFFLESERSQQDAAKEVEARAGDEVELNLDTMTAYLREKYPDRENSDRESVSELVEEIAPFGYQTLSHLDNVLTENEHRLNDNGWFSDVGAVRTLLRKVDSDYNEALMRRWNRIGGEGEDEEADNAD